jgi:hypothetical protein
VQARDGFDIWRRNEKAPKGESQSPGAFTFDPSGKPISYILQKFEVKLLGQKEWRVAIAGK